MPPRKRLLCPEPSLSCTKTHSMPTSHLWAHQSASEQLMSGPCCALGLLTMREEEGEPREEIPQEPAHSYLYFEEKRSHIHTLLQKICRKQNKVLRNCRYFHWCLSSHPSSLCLPFSFSPSKEISFCYLDRILANYENIYASKKIWRKKIKANPSLLSYPGSYLISFTNVLSGKNSNKWEGKGMGGERRGEGGNSCAEHLHYLQRAYVIFESYRSYKWSYFKSNCGGRDVCLLCIFHIYNNIFHIIVF